MKEISNFGNLFEYEPTTIIGTRMDWYAVSKYVGYRASYCDHDMTRLARELCVYRGYLKKTKARTLKLYELPRSAFVSLTDGRTVLMRHLQTGLDWMPDVAFTLRDFKQAEAVARDLYPNAELDQQARALLVETFSNLLDNKFIKVDLLH